MTDEETPLDRAHLEMEAAGDAPGPRLRFFERLLDAELHVLLAAESPPDRLDLQVLDIDEGRVVLAFDRDERMAAFLDAPAPYAALSGRRLAALLAGQGVGIALNAAGAPSTELLDATTVDWLAAMAGGDPTEEAARPVAVTAPAGADPGLIEGLGAKLAAMADALDAAWLATLRFGDGTERLALAIAGAAGPAEAGIASAIAEAVRFSGLDDGGLDVTFVAAGTPARAAFARNGLAFDIPAAHAPEPTRAPAPPGSDPDRPPRLR